MEKIIPDVLAPYATLIIVLVLALICKVLLDLYLNTKSGFLLRAVGDNDVLVVSLAKDKGNIKILGLAISNGLVAWPDVYLHRKREYLKFLWEPELWS